MVLSDPTWTFAAPLMEPWTTMTRGPEAIAAAESWGSVLTVVVGPPAPPLVLDNGEYIFEHSWSNALTRHSAVHIRCLQHR
jgi:hypothetical protein